jgi:beta-lactamase regulating signal transducer with metallopeptidase domain
MLLQSSILIGLLVIADLCLRKKVSARFRYGMWLLVLVKLVLPPSLAMPTGAAYWLGKYIPEVSTKPEPATAVDFSFEFPAAYAGPLQAATAAPIRETRVVATPHVTPLRWPGVAMLLWIAGGLALTAVVLWQIASLRRSLRRSRPAGQEMIDLLEECRADLGIATPVTVRLIDDLRSPAVCGFLRPVILLPAAMPPGLWPEGVRTILIHELIHVRRRDPLLSLAQTVLQVAYFWHPLVWAANARLRFLRELAVDETVVAGLRSQAQRYTDTLVEIAAMTFRKPALSLRLIGIAESKRALERRITHMLNRHISNRRAPGWLGLLAILALGAVLVPMGQGSATALAQQRAAHSAPALPPGIAELFNLDKDAVLAQFGKPVNIFLGDQTYTLDNLPEAYFMVYEGLSFAMNDGKVDGITLHSPNYVFSNDIHVGDSEEKIKKAFGKESGLQETEFKDFLNYEALDLSFEIDKQDRTVIEINIGKEYGDPAHVQAYANAAQFAAELPHRIAAFAIDSADMNEVLATFGQPVKYIWGQKTLSPDELPNRFIAVYPGSFQVFMLNNRVVEIRHEGGSKYAFAGKLRIGSTLDEALAVLGAPDKTVQGEEIDWGDSKNVLFRDIAGQKGHGYYHRPDKKVRVWFWNDKVSAIYMTRSDYGQDDEPSDPEFARLLQTRVDALDIDTAGREQVIGLFGPPSGYVWGDKTFTADALPGTYIMRYPYSLDIWLQKGRIMEIRHGRHGQVSPYVYRGMLRVGSTIEEAIALLGEPTETVAGPTEFKDGILYRNDGDGYYHRSDQKVRLFFAGGEVIAIYMTRSDFPVEK